MEFQGKDSERGFRERDAEQNRLDALRDDYYKIYIHAAECELTGTAALTGVGGLPAVTLDAGASDSVRRGIVKPKLWRRGELTVTVYWSTDGTDTAVMRLRVAVNAQTVGSAITTGTDLIDDPVNIAPTSTADILYDDDWTTNVTDTLDTHAVLAFVFQRLGAVDLNTDKCYFIGAVVEFLPNRRQ